MAALNPLTRELVFKIVFYGPGLGGKTTTLQHIHATAKPEHRGNMVSLATDTDRTLYFDFLPLQLLKLRNVSVRLQLFTVPGQVYYGATRKLVLTGADGIVFVADSQAARFEANQESLDDLNANLAEHGRSLSQIPHMFQWNKRDLGDIVKAEDLDRRLNLFSAPAIETIATRGQGIFPALEQVTRAVFNAYRAELPRGKRETVPLFLDAEEVGLADAIRELADSGRGSSPNVVAIHTPPHAPGGRVAAAGARALEAAALKDPPKLSPPIAPALTPQSYAAEGPTSQLLTEPPSLPLPMPSPPMPAPGKPVSGAVSPRPMGTESQPLPQTLSPVSAAQLSFAELWPDMDREGVRRAETLIAARDATSAVIACEVLFTRVLAEVSVALGPADHAREPAMLAMLLGIAGPRYLAFRVVVKAARQKRDVTSRDALDAFLLAIDARKALDRLLK
jgi:signal recognition particle receptor subunit beta